MGRGVPVEQLEVQLCAKRNCRRCEGRGFVWWQGAKTTCECASSRFMRANRDKVTVTDDGNVWWQPPTTGAARAAVDWFRAFFAAFFSKRSES